jgi:hypothetical protein
VLAVVLLLPACGGQSPTSPATTTQSQRAQASPEELQWARQVDGFAAGLVPSLRQLERLTGGGPKTGAMGRRLDPRIFSPGPRRAQFLAAMTVLAACGTSLEATVPQPPTRRLDSARATLVHACAQLELVPAILRSAVLRAGSPVGVAREDVNDAKGRAGEGVRSLVDGLATLRRVLG